MEARLVDTNVMLAASAIHRDLLSLDDNGAEPPEPQLREIAYNALRAFEESERYLVLDEEQTIAEEYGRNMSYNEAMRDQEYGLQVVQEKIQRCQVNWVTIDVVEGNGERIAVLCPELEPLVHDREDRKWIAAGLAHHVLHEVAAPIMYAAEFDWYHLESQTSILGIEFERLLPDSWYEEKFARDA